MFLMALKKELGLFDALAIGIGAIIGAGIFVITGIAAGLAGPALLLSLLISACIATFTALSFAELAAVIPKEGGGYEFARELVSPFAGFIAGWLWLLSNVVVGAVVSLGFASYLALFVPLPVKAMAVTACLAITLINYFGVRESGLVNDALVVIKLAILIFFVVVGLGAVKLNNFSPFLPRGSVGLMQGAALIFFAYTGFARITIVSEEVKEPEKTIPRAIVLALVLSTIIYLLVSFTAIGLVGYHELATSGSPLADAAMSESRNAAKLISLGAIAAILSVLLTTLLGLSRLSFSMARNNDLPQLFANLHPKHATPYYAIVVSGVLMAFFAAFTDILRAVSISNFASLLYYSIANYAALKLNKPRYPRIIPVIGLLSCISLLLFLTHDAWIMGGIAIVAGLVYYKLGRGKSFRVTSAST
jgi:APA family basic amino acid/polyamine antiporter